ncbi:MULTISPECIES: nucleotidyl transferase AbiEii/AbiGii toxin family protein [unclassified Acetobacterium]|uniref:nucleotidyl transferase AbiEii/AbiGii toxin family protein n=1 Tax=unclassified Acetobacterium TaxID=2638182 RepID=UPI0013A6CFBD|nr:MULTISPECIES: nucleotidyl transferase AbiEii/AbiGii toxin family protein [unclassified Acetobacterium]MDZ5725942.1 nucleotidyl transferase AbiEii/AbiGii toxin family protein [Acetobacterium sp. K1/6]
MLEIRVIENTLLTLAFPVQELKINSLVANYLQAQQFPEIIKTYHLEPFPVYVQDIGRTFIDKVFAVCDYYIENNPTEHSRHLYDISMIIDRLDDLESLVPLIAEVRIERHNNSSCHSADKDLNGILNQIIEEYFYRRDYEKITSQLLYDPVAYDDVILTLRKIIESRLFAIDC